MDTPLVIRVELEGIRRTFAYMLRSSNDELASLAEKVLEERLTGDVLKSSVEQIAKQEIDKAVREAVEQYFRWGNGRKTLRSIVDAILDEALPRSEQSK